MRVNQNKITLHLSDNMNVTGITQDRIPLAFTHQSGLLDIYTAQTLNPDEEFTVIISYDGFPQSGLNFSDHEEDPIIWSLDEPFGAREWFPCYDVPSDRATVEMRITVPDSLIAASNGDLVDVVPNADNTRTYIWEENYPISTYLISIAATNYGEDHPVYNPPLGHLFCEIEYEKAAWVLHMLRFVVGEDNFWKILKEYVRLYAYSNASTEDFQAMCEQMYSAELGWFFNQWIFGAGYPSYQFGWGCSAQNRVRVVINQIQEEFPVFKMPIELAFMLPSGTEKKIVWVDRKENTFEFDFEERPLNVLFDPDAWILCEVKDFQKKGIRER